MNYGIEAFYLQARKKYWVLWLRTFDDKLRPMTSHALLQSPTMHGVRELVDTGGLSYGPHWPDMWRRSADFVDKILRGAKPADLPVEQPIKFELVINLKTARAISLDVPPMLLARVGEVLG
jgi:hypothetical protein